jgi:hypothetical protein
MGETSFRNNERRATTITARSFSIMEHRAIVELISEAERALNDSRSRVEKEQQIIARRKEIGADLSESMELLKNLETTVSLRERRLRLRQWLARYLRRDRAA